MRAAAADGRIGPGSIPAILQGRGSWPLPLNGWSLAIAPDAPVGPVWQVTATGGQQNCGPAYMQAPPGRTVLISAWLRAVIPGAGLPTSGVGIWLDVRLATGSSVFPKAIDVAPANVPTTWTPYQGLYVLPANAVSIKPFATLRTSVTAGTFQLCGARLSIIGAMPV